MELSAQEIAMLMHVMRYLPEMTHGVTNSGIQVEVPKGRQFSEDEQLMAMHLFKKFKGCTKEDKYVDSEITLDTEEKAFLLKLLSRPWGAEELEIQVPLKDKLKK